MLPSIASGLRCGPAAGWRQCVRVLATVGGVAVRVVPGPPVLALVRFLGCWVRSKPPAPPVRPHSNDALVRVDTDTAPLTRRRLSMISVLPEEDGPTSSIHTGGPGMSLAATVASAASTAVWSGRQCRRRTYVISTHAWGRNLPGDGISTHTPGLTISRSSLAHHCHGCGRSQRPTPK
jgi:hypothetical protein